MKKALSILGGIICTIVCIFLFAIQIAFMTFESAKTVVSKNSINQIVKEVNIKEIISIDPGSTSDLYGFFDTLGLSVEETDKVLASNAFKEFLSEYLNNNIDNIINDKNISIDYSSVVRLVNDIETETNVTFKDKEKFLKLLETKFPEIEKSINISNFIKEELDQDDIHIARILLSKTVTIAFVAIFIIVYLIMCLFRFSLYKPLLWYGITTSLSSFVMFQLFLAIGSIKDFIPEESKSFEFIISPILKVIKNKGLIVSGIMLAVGVVMIVAFTLINKKMKEVEKSENFEQLEDNTSKAPDTL